MPDARNPLAVALLYPTSQLGGPMREALSGLGAAVVYEAMAAEIDRDALEDSGARVVIVNLGADSDDYIDQVYDVLDAGDYHVVFNEAHVSDHLSGWDHARWARNLAAKIMSQPEIAEPPRPLGAEPVPTPVQSSASQVPVAEKPGPVVAPTPAPNEDVVPAAREEIAPPPPRTSAADAPTVVLEVPEEFKKSPAADDGGLDFASLEEFSALSVPDADTKSLPDDAASQRPIESIEIAADTDTNFAAELDALFASTDDTATSTPVQPAEVGADPIAQNLAQDDTGLEIDLGIDLPPEFNLVDIPVSEPVASEGATPQADAPDEHISFELPDDETADEPGLVAKDDPNAMSDELSLEFPAIFDQLDASAAEIPVASDSTFKPAARPEYDAGSAKPVLAPQWDLEPVHDISSAESPELSKPEDFGIEKVAAEDFLTPKVEPPSSGQNPNLPAGDGLTLELMPMEEAIAPPSNYSHENWLDEGRPAQKLRVGGDNSIQRVVVLGASIGGPEAVRDFLAPLPAGFPVLFIVVQHMGEEFLQLMAAQLRRSITLTVREPTHGEQVGNGEVLIVPTTHRLKVNAEGVVTLEHLPEKMPYSPSIDQVLRDMADRFGDKACAIIFSGMAHDAIEGSRIMKSKGGTIWAQDPQSCVVSSMVDGVRAAGLVGFTGTPAQLAEKMIAEYGAK
ncbi:MAG TPA: chemotaxis protein CheB [Rudaea sp.]|nr:chemotaxis protein CheB [Rudaea sp.]